MNIKKRHPSGEKALFPPEECIICGKDLKWFKIKGVSKRDKLIKNVLQSQLKKLLNNLQSPEKRKL